MSVVAFILETLLPLVLKYLPDVARALSGAADRGELDEPTAAIVRRTLPARGESGAVLDELRAARVEWPDEYDKPESD